MLGESLANKFSIVLVCENFALAENRFSFNSAEDHFSHNSGAQSWGLPGGQGGPNFSSHNSVAGRISWGLPGGQGGPNFSSFNSVAGESLSNNFTTVLECKKMFVAPNFFPPLIKAPTLALQAEPKLGPPWGAGRPQVYGV